MSGREDFSLYSRDSQRDTEKATFLVNGAILILNALWNVGLQWFAFTI